MLIDSLITQDVPVLKDTDTVEQALRYMEDFKITHLPILHHKKLVGLAAENELLDVLDTKKRISDTSIAFLKPVLHLGQHAFDALRMMSNLHLSLIPVTDEKGIYLGSITQKSVVEKLANLSGVMEQGGIIELEINKNDYSLTQIAGIVEGNDAKIISLYVTSLPDDSSKIEVTIKINREDLSRILQTFSRYNYTVKASYHQAEYEDDLKHRFNAFIKYLDI
ncbi:MAG: CBS domain-containing protein [Bacteroidetes bacterium]|nr:CBS domain-containing protein [Bacteroidota bacterium]